MSSRTALPTGIHRPLRSCLRQPQAIRVALVMWLAAMLAACTGAPERLDHPLTLVAPYDTAAGDVLWAVVPLRNDSGTSAADALAISDRIVAAAAQVRGVRCLPLNRTLQAMQALQLAQIRTPADVRTLASALGVDGVLVGAITAYDPYQPPTLGLSLALYVASEAPFPEQSGDPSALRLQPTDRFILPRSHFADAPASVVAVHLDARNHAVLADLRDFARGRHERHSALGWRGYVASMDRFTDFAAWYVIRGLLQREWVRVGGVQQALR